MKNWLLILFLLLPINVFAGNGSQQLFGEWNTVVVNGCDDLFDRNNGIGWEFRVQKLLRFLMAC